MRDKASPTRRTRTRSNGEGSKPRQRKDGSWQANYTAGWTPEGRQIIRSVYGRTRAEVADKLKLKLAATERGAVVQAEHGKLTLADYASASLEARRAEVAPGTYAKLGSYLVILRAARLGAMPITQVKAAHLEAFYADLAPRYAADTVRHIANFINQVFRRAKRHELVRDHPGLVAQLPRMKAEPFRRRLSDDELRAILAASQQTAPGERPLFPLLVVAAALGLRHSEVLGLRWNAVDFAAGTLQVQLKVVRREASSDLKSKAAYRTLYLTPDVARVLLEHRASEARTGPNDYLFQTDTGGPLDQNNVRRSWRRVLERSGVEGRVRLHDLRGTFISRLIEQGADPRAVADLAGHADPRMTLSVYAQSTAERRKAILLNQALPLPLSEVRNGETKVEREEDEAS